MKRLENSYLPLWISLGFALLAALWLQWPRLIDPYTIEKDFNYTYWMYRFQDAELFVNDINATYRIIEFNLGSLHLIVDAGSPAYSLLFHLVSFVITPILFSKLLVFPLLLWAVYYIYRIFAELRDPKTAIVASMAFTMFNLALHTEISTVGGLQRSFVMPFLLGITYYLIHERYVATAVIIFMAGVIYPPMFVLGCIMYGLSLLTTSDGHFPITLRWTKIPPLLVVVVLVVICLLPMIFLNLESAATTSMSSNPVFANNGRYEFFSLFPLVGRGGITTFGEAFVQIIILFALTVAIWIMRPSTMAEVPMPLKLLFWASIIGYGIAWVGILLTDSVIFYIPNRYTQSSFLLFGFIFVLLHAKEAIYKAATFLTKPQHQTIFGGIAAIVGVVLVLSIEPTAGYRAIGWKTLRWVLLALSLLIPILLLAKQVLRSSQPVATLQQFRPLTLRGWLILLLPLLLASFFYVKATASPFFVAQDWERALFQYAETLPKDSLIAGSPCSLAELPIFGKRQILFSCYRPNRDPQIMLDGLRAYYEETATEILPICEKYGIDYLLVQPNDLTQKYIAQGHYNEPYDSILQQELAGQTSFALLNVPDDLKIFSYDSFYMVACDQSLLLVDELP